jgi:hypothetical protein
MAEILTESFCERCGTRYTFESAARRPSPLGVLGTVGRGIRNFVAMPDASLDEAFAVARAETEQGATAHQLEAFHRTFNFCLSCRQYTCAECWNAVEGRCLSCAPLPEVETRADLAEASESTTIAAAGTIPPMFAAGPADLAWPVIDAAPTSGTIELPASRTEAEDEAEAPEEALERSSWEAQAAPEVAQADHLAETEPAEAASAEPEPAEPGLEVESAEPEVALLEVAQPEVAEQDLIEAAVAEAGEAEPAAELVGEPAPAAEEPAAPRPDLGSLLAAGAALGPMVADALEESGEPPADEVAPEPEVPATDTAPSGRPARFPGFEPGANLDAEIEAYDLRVAAVSQPLPPSTPEALAPAAARPAPMPESARPVERFVAASPGQRAVRSEAIPEVPAVDPATAVPVAPVGTCPSCGLTLSASARFCRRCGTAQHP